MSAAAAPSQILLVEQNYVLRRTVATVARDLGVAQVVEVAHGEAAVASMRVKSFDGLLLDLDLGPAASELLTRLRQGEFMTLAETPVIGLTAQTGHAVETHIAQHTLSRLIRKPFKVSELLRTIAQMTSRVDSERESGGATGFACPHRPSRLVGSS